MAAKKKFPEQNTPEFRILLAKDVIKQIKLKKLIPEHYAYFISTDLWDEKADKSVQEILKKKQTTCKVCALGALWASKVKHINEATVGELDADYPAKIQKDLQVIFGYEQVELIEKYFEGWLEAKYYYRQFTNAKDRMIAIMQNIIRNKGTFVEP